MAMGNDQLWEAALGQLELTVSQANFLTWFAHTKIQKRIGGVITVVTPSAFTYEWLSKKYRTSVLSVLQNLDNKVSGVEFTIESTSLSHKPLKKHFHVMARKAARAKEVPVVKEPVEVAAPAAVSTNKKLNTKYSFESFVVGSSNEIAHASCRAVAEHPGEEYNPLFIYGGVGLGKTHLLQSIGSAVTQKNPSARVLYVSAEKFISDFVNSIRDRSVSAFKRQYREVDVLIIDDVQFLAGKAKCQEELFHTFNALHGQNKQIILSSDRSPRAIPTVEERLRSRLAGGMTVDIKQPDYETRLAIISEKAALKNITIEKKALEYIAKNIQKNVRELEGALNRVVGHGELSGQPLTLAYAQKILEGILEQTHQKTVKAESVLDVVSSYYNITIDDLCGKSRKKEIVRPRQVAMHILRKENKMSFPTIGEHFGGRDHTTAMHACEKIEKLLEHDEELVQELTFIRERLYA